MILRFLRQIVRDGAPYVLAFAIFLVGIPWIPLNAQRYQEPVTQDDRDIGDINRRLNDIDKLNVPQRISVLETIVQDLKDQALWNKLSTTGIGVLLGERAVIAISKKRKEDEED